MTNLAGSAASGPVSAASMPKVCPICGVRYPVEFKVCPRDAVELAEVDADAEHDEIVGKTLSQTYSIVRVIGEGGMGRVYEARHTRIGSKRFAIKMLHPEFARQPEVISRFQREAEAAASIQSPHVVDVYDVDRTDDGRPFMVGEFLEGKEFADYLIESGKMPVGPAVRIVRQICKALATAHSKGVVHRDMKPENVFLTGDMSHPTAKVIDFGISKTGDTPGTALTKTGMIMGTPSYMAPEQARGEKVDHRADIYAVGAILYCAVTGSRPFDRGDPTATLTAVLTEDPKRPRAIEPSVPEPLEMIIQRAMAKMPPDRYQSMAELDADLAPYDPGDSELIVPMPLATDGKRGAGAPTVTSRAGRAATLDRQTREVSMARPMIVLMSVVGGFWVLGSLITTITAVVRMMRGGTAAANLTSSESVLLLLGVFFALVTPAYVLARHVGKAVWGNSVKSVDFAERVRRPVVVGLGAYGFGSLLVRVIEAVLLRRAVGVAWPMWDLLLFVIGAVAAASAMMLLRMERPRS
jgi:tRNA A-37 threonylcarbamoyl transferase component Bud32